ncbi:hypothetical protein OAF34_02435 [Pirellulaceae bacterium]|jgi:hypothetical protein|nr:hypothetical protein [Pirellulaceae bacterium]
MLQSAGECKNRLILGASNATSIPIRSLHGQNGQFYDLDQFQNLCRCHFELETNQIDNSYWDLAEEQIAWPPAWPQE